MMKDEYDFSKAERGKFFKAAASMNLPAYINAEIFDYLSEKAKLKGVELSDMVNDMLKKNLISWKALKAQNNSHTGRDAVRRKPYRSRSFQPGQQ